MATTLPVLLVLLTLPAVLPLLAGFLLLAAWSSSSECVDKDHPRCRLEQSTNAEGEAWRCAAD